jgi:hypothetical protein
MRERIWRTLEYRDPKALLIGFAQIADDYPLETLPYKIASLRTNDTNHFREARQCALFCYGMSQKLGVEIGFAPFEDSDTDFVAAYKLGDETHFVPIQMKELVPEQVADQVDLQKEIDKLGKYVSSNDLVVAFHLNRTHTVEISKLDFSKVPVKELWFVGATIPDQSNWVLLGNLLSPNWRHYFFPYPVA